jgi:alkylated DNA nucleotide flippase Atl1
VNLFKFGPGSPPTPAFPNQLPIRADRTGQLPREQFRAAAPLVDDFRDIGPLGTPVITTSYRAVAELAGSIGEMGRQRLGRLHPRRHEGELLQLHRLPGAPGRVEQRQLSGRGSNSAAVLNGGGAVCESTSTNELSVPERARPRMS